MAAPPDLYAAPAPASVAAAVLERCTVLHTPFAPTPWAPNGHAQSALGGERGRGGESESACVGGRGGGVKRRRGGGVNVQMARARAAQDGVPFCQALIAAYATNNTPINSTPINNTPTPNSKPKQSCAR